MPQHRLSHRVGRSSQATTAAVEKSSHRLTHRIQDTPGVDIHTIQRLMGHGHISSTLRYFHLARKHLANTPSPLELLGRPETKPK